MAKKEELDNIAGNEKLRALQAAMDKIEKNFGKGSIMKLGDDNFEDEDEKAEALENYYADCTGTWEEITEEEYNGGE